MKKILLNLIVMSFTIMVSANEADLKSILTKNEWQLNINETLLLNDPSTRESKANLDEMISKLFDLKFSFGSDHRLKVKLLDIELYNGKYIINKDHLTFVNDLKNNKQSFKLISFNQNQIRIKDKKNNIFLVLSTMKTDLDPKTILITKNWKLDLEVMKPDLLIKMASVPTMKELSNEDRDAAIRSTLIILQGVRYHFKEDNSLEYSIKINNEVSQTIKGTFKINLQEKELVIDLENGEKNIFKITSIDENKVALTNTNNNLNFVFIQEKK